MELDVWLAKIKQARSHREVFAILDDFKKFDWEDAQCSKMSRLYMRILENLGMANADDNLHEAPANSAAAVTAQLAVAGSKATDSAAGVVNDGPVWYEKM